jgi:RimJ/RimL family protein N-acetyltransferase
VEAGVTHADGPTAAAETIETPRLLLRAHRTEDAEGYAALWRPPADGPVHTPVLDAEGSWARLLRLIGHRAVFGFAPFLVVERETGGIVGEAGHARFRRGLGPSFDGSPEAMWILLPERRGRGLAEEAMRAAIDDLVRRIGVTRSVAMIDPTNAASLALAGRLGFHHFGEGDHHGTRMRLFERRSG